MIYIPPLRGFVRTFIFICVAVFVLQQFALHGPFGGTFRYSEFIKFFGLVPEMLFKGMIFQPITWIFLHGSFSHLLFNMLGLWMFGSLLEDVWGTKRFMRFIFLAGALTGILVGCFGLFDPYSYSLPTIGASGVVFAVLVAVSRMFPNQVVLFFFVFPMKMKYFAYLMIALEFYALYTSNEQGISNIAHLSGAAVGYFLSRGGPGNFKIANWWRNLQDRWHQRRMRKKLRIIRVNEKTTYH
ncbi:MAG: hypothetical protein JWQ35_666 [Bacteriovoracaceae bacterium]|nr:hypothetical protein [Bacteriovoracaceae bacterium]